MFTSARIKLTLWYLLIIMMVSVTFSVVIFSMVSREVDRFEQMQRTRVERRLREEIIMPQGPGSFRRFLEENRMASPELVQETKDRILHLLLIANGSICILAGWFGYILAGRTLKPIKEMVDNQNRFISDASHELKTPLASLKIALEVYLRDPRRTINDADTVVSESIDEIDKLQTLSESLLNISSYEGGQEKLSMHLLTTQEVIDEVIHKTKYLAHRKKIELKTEINQAKFQGDKNGILNLLTILVDNAIKYSSKESTITINTKVQEHMLVITVKDEGIGISEEDLPRVFDRFYRADSARSKSGAGGNGLGLSIARQIAIQHGGSLHAESTLGKGSTFILELPLK